MLLPLLILLQQKGVRCIGERVIVQWSLKLFCVQKWGAGYNAHSHLSNVTGRGHQGVGSKNKRGLHNDLLATVRLDVAAVYSMNLFHRRSLKIRREH